MRRRFLAATMLAGLGWVLGTGWASAQDAYPSRPIKFVVPFSAGSATDTLARVLGEKMTAALGQAIVVDNMPGASGFLGAQNVARAEPDGHTVLIATNTTHAANQSLFKKLPYDPIRDFEPVSRLGTITLALIVNPSVPAASTQELIAYGKANPGKLTFGSGSSSSRLAAEMLRSLAGIDMVNVPYKSNLQGYELTAWFAAYVPAGTPEAVVEKLNGAMRTALADEAAVKTLLGAGIEPGASTPEELKAFTVAETEKWARIVKAAGIEPE